jgi:Fe-S cluster biogenesis protein NfuA
MLFVQDIDLTPNPNALKFVLNENLLKNETRSYSNKDAASDDPFAKEIFEIDGVVSVFYMQKFVTIEKKPDTNWSPIQKSFSDLIKNLDQDIIPPEKESFVRSSDESETFNKINEVIDQRVRPALAGDGGGLDILDYKDNVLKIRYIGACGTCPSAIRGTLVAIENLLRREINPTIEVVSADL